MYIDYTGQIEKYLNAGQEIGKKLPEAKSTNAGAVNYGKLQECYQMTGSCSFFVPDAFYQKPEKEEETIVEQLDTQMEMSPENRKNQMIVLLNTVSGEDLEELSKNGFSGADMDSHTIITVTDRIKTVLAKAGVDISVYGDTLDATKLEEITGNKALANQIANALASADLPVSKANVDESQEAYAVAEELEPLDDNAKMYLLKNECEPTLKNIYTAEHSTAFAWKEAPVDISGMEKQIEQIIKNAGLEVNDASKSDCAWLLQKDIPLTVENLNYLNDLHALSENIENVEQGLDMQKVVERMAEAVRDGKRPMDAYIVDGYSYQDKAEAVYDTINNVEDCDIAYCIEQDLSLSVNNLQKAMKNRKEGETSVNAEMSSSLSFIKAKRQLEETRLLMTAEANYTLFKRGISIDTKPLEQVVENLKDLEQQYYKDLMNQAGISPSEENVSVFAETTKYVEELKFQPAYALQIDSAEENLKTLHASGNQLKAKMDSVMQSYETMWTAPRKDLGDSIQKAFGNIDAILDDLGLEKTPWNQRAVRILAYNETEITVDNINKIKETDMEVQKLFQNLTPANTLELIRRGENPLEMDIKQLNEVVKDIQNESSENENEKFSKFLWKLEKNQEISSEERDSYIGIYRLIAQVEQTDGAVIGALLNQGVDITMKNLLTAMRSAKKDVNYTVDDHFDGVKETSKGPKIDKQILASFQTDCIKQAKEILSPEKLEQLEDWEEMTPEELFEQLQEVTEEESALLEKEYYTETASEYAGILEASEDVYAFLEKYDQKNSVHNVLAAKRLLENPSHVFETLFNTDGKSADYQKMIADFKDEIMEKFGEAVKTPEALAEAEETLADTAEKVMQTMIIENETISVKDLRELRLMNQQFSFGGAKAKEESFLIPVQTGDSITGVNLKIVRGKENKGLVDIFFRGGLMGKVAASFEAKEQGIFGVIATTDEETAKVFEDGLMDFSKKMQEEETGEIRITVTKVKDLSAWQFEKNTLPEIGEKSEIQTKRLYHIAESFIQTMSGLM